MNERKTRADFAAALYENVIPMRRAVISGMIASQIEYAAKRGGFDPDNPRKPYGLKELTRTQRANVVEFIKAHCPRHPETGLWLPCW